MNTIKLIKVAAVAVVVGAIVLVFAMNEYRSSQEGVEDRNAVELIEAEPTGNAVVFHPVVSGENSVETAVLQPETNEERDTLDVRRHREPSSSSLGARFSRDPKGTAANLALVLTHEMEDGFIDAEESVALVERIEQAAELEDGMVEPAKAVRSVRCSSSLCEVLYETSQLGDTASTLAMMARSLRQSSSDYEMVLHAPYSDDSKLWSMYVLRKAYFEGR